MRGRHDRRDVLHLEGQRAGRLADDEAGLVAQALGDAPADARLVEFDLDVPAPDGLAQEAPDRSVDAVGDQHVPAGIRLGQDRQGHRGKARRGQRAVVGAGQRAQRVAQRALRRQPADAVERLVDRGGVQRAAAVGQYGRAALHWRVDDAGPCRGPADAREPGVEMSFLRAHGPR